MQKTKIDDSNAQKLRIQKKGLIAQLRKINEKLTPYESAEYLTKLLKLPNEALKWLETIPNLEYEAKGKWDNEFASHSMKLSINGEEIYLFTTSEERGLLYGSYYDLDKAEIELDDLGECGSILNNVDVQQHYLNNKDMTEESILNTTGEIGEKLSAEIITKDQWNSLILRNISPEFIIIYRAIRYFADCVLDNDPIHSFKVKMSKM